MPDESTVITSFPSAGTRTARNDLNAVEISNSTGEHLFYRLIVKGAQPAFVFGCKHRTVITDESFAGGPSQVYEWSWGRNSGDFDDDDDVYVLALSFAGAPEYSLVAEVRNEDGDLVKTAKDIDYESQVKTDKFREPLRVFSD
jgi:hypothetical protein